MPNGCARRRTLNPNARCDCRGYSTIRFRNEVTHGLDHRNRRKDRHDVITDIAEFSSVAAAAAIGLVLMFVGGVGFHSRGYAFLCAADAPCLRNLLADCPSDQLRNRTSLGAGVIRTPSLARPAAARCARLHCRPAFSMIDTNMMLDTSLVAVIAPPLAGSQVRAVVAVGAASRRINPAPSRAGADQAALDAERNL